MGGPPLTPDERRRRGKLALWQLQPKAIQVVKDDLNSGDGARAQWLLEMVLGKPRQEVTGEDGGPLQVAFTLNIGPRPPKEPDSTALDKTAIDDKDG